MRGKERRAEGAKCRKREREALQQQHHTDVSTSRVLRWMMMTKMGHLTEGTKGHQPPPPAKPRSSLFITAEKEGEVFETIGGKRREIRYGSFMVERGFFRLLKDFIIGQLYCQFVGFLKP